MKKKLLWSLGALVLVLIVLVGTAGWYFSDVIKNSTLKVDRRLKPPDLEVVRLSADRITLRTMPGTKTIDWKSDGLWGLERTGG